MTNLSFILVCQMKRNKPLNLFIKVTVLYNKLLPHLYMSLFTENVIIEEINVFIVFIFTPIISFQLNLVVVVFFSTSKGCICIWLSLVGSSNSYQKVT